MHPQHHHTGTTRHQQLLHRGAQKGLTRQNLPNCPTLATYTLPGTQHRHSASGGVGQDMRSRPQHTARCRSTQAHDINSRNQTCATPLRVCVHAHTTTVRQQLLFAVKLLSASCCCFCGGNKEMGRHKHIHVRWVCKHTHTHSVRLHTHDCTRLLATSAILVGARTTPQHIVRFITRSHRPDNTTLTTTTSPPHKNSRHSLHFHENPTAGTKHHSMPALLTQPSSHTHSQRRQHP